MRLKYGQGIQEATLWAFVENFRLFGLLSLDCWPLVFLFKTVRGRGVEVAAH